MSKPVFYVAEERAMAPGIAGEWPKVLPCHSKAGRLVKLDPRLCRIMDKAMDRFYEEHGCGDCGDLVKRRRLCHHCQLMVCNHCWHHVHRCEPGHKKSECRDLPRKKHR